MVHFAGHRGGDDAAVVAGQRQEFQRFGRQPLGFFRFAGVDRHLGAQGVELGVQRLVYLDFLFAHGALGALQQGVDLAVAVLALRQPGLQQRQLGVLDQALIRQRVEALLQQGQFAVVEQRPGVLQQDIAQHADVAGRQRVVNGLRRIPQRQPAFGSGAVQPRQLQRQFPLATLAQERGEQRVEVEPFAGVVHAVDKQPLTLQLLQPLLAVVFAGQPHDQRVVHRAQHRTAQQEGARIGIDVIQHFVHQVV